jgi:hypothetical protein
MYKAAIDLAMKRLLAETVGSDYASESIVVRMPISASPVK